ncbi:magnesium transporter [Motilimonas eburnea]|uniref:magnesium transporter n=1 Tax=Motilimonas eburnea TaxID=1737488 RepID=UPI001E458D8A|nr:magnesium transporter [Motilimonas eburnea]MCE2573466.1 magnesium transporter [Motilimonas eburnea]
MSKPQADTKPRRPRGSKATRFAINMVRAVGYIAGFIGLSWAISQLSFIHGTSLPESYFVDGYPSILALLDSELFMGAIFLITLAIIVYILYLLWQVHELAVHKAQSMSSAHTQLVFALSLCGLFIDKTWWVLAIIIAFARWDEIANQISKIINKGINGGQS